LHKPPCNKECHSYGEKYYTAISQCITFLGWKVRNIFGMNKA